MINNNLCLAIVTARGGSKSVPQKNIKLICGKPLISWTAKAISKSKYIDRAILTTDSKVIADIGKESGLECDFLRPKELSNDNSKQEDAIKHAMEIVQKNDKKYKYIIVLTPCHPLRETAEIDKCIEKIEKHEPWRGVVTIMECSSNPLFSNILSKNKNLEKFIPDKYKDKNRQELPTYYEISGSTCVFEWDYFLKDMHFFGRDTYAVKTDSVSGHDINSEIDFQLAEVLLNNRINAII